MPKSHLLAKRCASLYLFSITNAVDSVQATLRGLRPTGIALNFNERVQDWFFTKYCEIPKPGWWVVANTLAALVSFSTPDESWVILDNSDYVECRLPSNLVFELFHWELKYLTSQSPQGAQLDHPPSTVGRRLTTWKTDEKHSYENKRKKWPQNTKCYTKYVKPCRWTNSSVDQVLSHTGVVAHVVRPHLKEHEFCYLAHFGFAENNSCWHFRKWEY